MAQWQRRRYLVYELIDVAFQATGQTTPYTVGLGGQFNIPRPYRLESGFFRQFPSGGLPVDYPMSIINARENYNQISLKTMQSFPQYAFLDSAFPVANIFFWPTPLNIYELHITVMQQLQGFVNTTDLIAMPPEYIEPLMYNLAGRIAPMFGLEANQTTLGLARASMNILKAANAQIPTLNMPDGLNGRKGVYNPYGDLSL